MNDAKASNQTAYRWERRLARFLFSRRGLRALLFVGACMITLLAIFHAEENWRGQRAFERYRQGVEASGGTLDMAALIPPRVPDAENFCATPFILGQFQQPQSPEVTSRWPEIVSKAQTLLQARNTSERHVTDLVAMREALDHATRKLADKIQQRSHTASEQAEAATAVLTHLKAYEPVFNEFRANLSRPQAQYPVAYLLEDPFTILLPHLSRIRSIANVLQLRACAELAVGDSKAALDDVLLQVRLSDGLKNEHFLISKLVRIAMLQATTQPVWEGLATHRWTDEQLATLGQRFGEMDLIAELVPTLSMERACGIVTIGTARRRGFGDYIEALSGSAGPGGQPERHNVIGNVVGKIVPRGWFRLEQVSYGRLFDRVGEITKVKLPDPFAIKSAAESVKAELTRNRLSSAFIHHKIMAGLLLPALDNSYLRFIAGQISMQQVATACALERYRLANGDIPETLEGVVPCYLKAVPFDYFAHGPIKYRRTGTNSFVLYSIGQDGKDDGGKPGKHWNDPKQGDIVWAYPAAK